MVLVLIGCASTLDDTTPIVDEPRVLAVSVEPAEVEAGGVVQFSALYADVNGEIPEAELTWSFCTARRPLAELGPVAQSCLDAESADQRAIGTGGWVNGTVPGDACSLFGPNPPPSDDGTSAGRPVDPDTTGGFFQPAFAFDGEQPSYAPVRVRCGLANVTQETYVAWNSGYVSNTRPDVTLTAPPSVAAGEAVTLSASWPECGDGVCGGAETYVVYNADTKTLDARRESMSATWFATGGIFDVARNGRSNQETDTSVDNIWTAPESGTATIWVVLRDERGGVRFTGADVEIGG